MLISMSRFLDTQEGMEIVVRQTVNLLWHWQIWQEWNLPHIYRPFVVIMVYYTLIYCLKEERLPQADLDKC